MLCFHFHFMSLLILILLWYEFFNFKKIKTILIFLGMPQNWAGNYFFKKAKHLVLRHNHVLLENNSNREINWECLIRKWVVSFWEKRHQEDWKSQTIPDAANCSKSMYHIYISLNVCVWFILILLRVFCLSTANFICERP